LSAQVVVSVLQAVPHVPASQKPPQQSPFTLQPVPSSWQGSGAGSGLQPLHPTESESVRAAQRDRNRLEVMTPPTGVEWTAP
jgi:hypothetical protein